MYRETKDPKYLEQAHKIVRLFFIIQIYQPTKFRIGIIANPVKNVMLQQVLLLLLPYLS
jgi:hypothetical protein